MNVNRERIFLVENVSKTNINRVKMNISKVSAGRMRIFPIENICVDKMEMLLVMINLDYFDIIIVFKIII